MKLRISYGNILKTYSPANWKIKKKLISISMHMIHKTEPRGHEQTDP
jgi:hypothetical protein